MDPAESGRSLNLNASDRWGFFFEYGPSIIYVAHPWCRTIQIKWYRKQIITILTKGLKKFNQCKVVVMFLKINQ